MAQNAQDDYGKFWYLPPNENIAKIVLHNMIYLIYFLKVNSLQCEYLWNDES